jgi:hypothetical protein
MDSAITKVKGMGDQNFFQALYFGRHGFVVVAPTNMLDLLMF